jgi:hypothetical protein
LIAAGALWIEMRPDPAVPHPFAIEEIAVGTVVDQSNTEVRAVPAGTFAPIELGMTALQTIPAGAPILTTDVGHADEVVPTGWWVVEVPLPLGAQRGDVCRLVLLDGGEAVDGVVVAAAVDDPLGSGLGMIAVEPGPAADVARAAAEGRVAVMIASP